MSVVVRQTDASGSIVVEKGGAEDWPSCTAPDKKVQSGGWLGHDRQCYPFSFRAGCRRHCRLGGQLAPRPTGALAAFAVTDLARLGRWREKFARLADCDPIRHQLRIEWSDDARVLRLCVLATCAKCCSEIQHVVLSAVMVMAGYSIHARALHTEPICSSYLTSTEQQFVD